MKLNGVHVAELSIGPHRHWCSIPEHAPGGFHLSQRSEPVATVTV